MTVDVIDHSTPEAEATRRAPTRSRNRRRPREFTPFDVWMLVGSLVSSLCLNWLIFYRFTDGVSPFGYLLATYAVFLGIFAIVSTERVGRVVAADRVMTVVVVSAATVVFVPLVLLVGYIVVKGLVALRPAFFFNDQTGVTPVDPATDGGGSHAIIGTSNRSASRCSGRSRSHSRPRSSSTSREVDGVARSGSSSTR